MYFVTVLESASPAAETPDVNDLIANSGTAKRGSKGVIENVNTHKQNDSH